MNLPTNARCGRSAMGSRETMLLFLIKAQIMPLTSSCITLGPKTFAQFNPWVIFVQCMICTVTHNMQERVKRLDDGGRTCVDLHQVRFFGTALRPPRNVGVTRKSRESTFLFVHSVPVLPGGESSDPPGRMPGPGLCFPVLQWSLSADGVSG
ncbi:MAG: hypothetical protein ACYDDO_06105 [Acidiferrobacterales bacterium]